MTVAADQPTAVPSHERQPGAARRGTILHVFDHSLPKADGYAYRSAEIIRFQRRAGWHTVHVTSAKHGPAPQAAETASGLEFHRTQPGWLRRFPVLNQWDVVTTLRARLEGLVARERPDLVHVHSPCLNGLAALPVARRLRIPLVYEVRALWEDGAVDSGVIREGDLRYRVSRVLEAYVCRRATQIVTLCEGLRADLLGRGLADERITLVPSSVDLDRFLRTGSRSEALAESLGLQAGKTLGFIGTFFPYEGLELLVRAMPRILAGEPRTRLLLVGDGQESGRLKGLVAELGVGDAVVFTGRVPHADVASYYDLVDILVYPRVSKRVTEVVTPLKPLEAMAQGKVVLASDVGGHREMVFPGQNGVLFRAGDPRALAIEALQLLARPQDWPRLGENGKAYVRTERGWDRNVEIYSRLYERLLAATPR